jgi:hypothetical protein
MAEQPLSADDLEAIRTLLARDPETNAGDYRVLIAARRLLAAVEQCMQVRCGWRGGSRG